MHRLNGTDRLQALIIAHDARMPFSRRNLLSASKRADVCVKDPHQHDLRQGADLVVLYVTPLFLTIAPFIC